MLEAKIIVKRYTSECATYRVAATSSTYITQTLEDQVIRVKTWKKDDNWADKNAQDTVI